MDWLSTTADQGARDYWEAKTQDLLIAPPTNAYIYALVGGAISIRDPYICAVSRVCANESHAVFHGPVVCAVKT